MGTLEWVGEALNEGQIVEREFVIETEAGAIPGIVWMPEEAEEPVPLVLFGHGGSGHKRVSRAVMLGRRLAGVSQYAMVAIDGPAHGGRQGPRLEDLYAEKGFDSIIDGMVGDWTATLDCFAGMDAIDENRVGYAGFSMGCRFGLPFVAAEGDRLRCAALGKNALQRRGGADANDALGDRFRRDAPNVNVPVFFHLQWDDELFARESQCDLFDLIGSADKRMVCYTGPHGRSSPEAVDDWCRFLKRYLG
ncbi:MAG: hypothetical protein OXI91_01075 [Chloroflexota bacterium]|nr:hypothetical protein [Chloroflexota bacterium]